MDKLKYIKLENEDGSYSSSIPLAVDSDYVDVNGVTLTTKLSSKADAATTSASINDLYNQIDAIVSGSPSGTYATVTELTTADPDHDKIYLVTANGHWYYYGDSAWQDGGTYQATEIPNSSISRAKLGSSLSNELIINRTYLSPGADLNDYYTSGIYVLTSGAYLHAYANYINSCVMIVERGYTGSTPESPNYNYCVQRIYDRTTNVAYKRFITGTLNALTYSDWYLIDIDYREKGVLEIKQFLPHNTYLNQILEPGYYGLETGTFYDGPVSQLRGFLEVHKVTINAYAYIKQILYSLEDSFGNNGLVAERMIIIRPNSDPEYQSWTIKNGEQYYNYITTGDLNNYKTDGKIYLLGYFTNAPINTEIRGMLEIKTVHTYETSNFKTISHIVFQKIILQNGDKIYLRTIRWSLNNDPTISDWHEYGNIDKPHLNILTLGDSILGMPEQYITQQIQTHYSGTVYNCNFGGTTAVDRTSSNFQAFSFVNLVDAKLANDFTSQESALELSGIPDYFSNTLTRFKNVDMSTIDVCLVMYGTNDFNSNYPIGNISDNNKTSILGSLRRGIQALSEEYPNIKFIILNPLYRHFSAGDSKTYRNTNNVTLDDLDNKEIELAEDMYLNYIDMRKMGINEHNYTYWLADGVHVKNATKPKVGDFIANNIS